MNMKRSNSQRKKAKKWLPLTFSIVLTLLMNSVAFAETNVTRTATYSDANTNLALGKTYTIERAAKEAEYETWESKLETTNPLTNGKADEEAYMFDTGTDRCRIVLDFEDVTSFNEFRLYNWRPSGFKNYEIYCADTNDSGTLWTLIDEGAVNWERNGTNEYNTTWDLHFNTQRARYLKIELSEYNGWQYNYPITNQDTSTIQRCSLSELYVYNRPYYASALNYANAEIYSGVKDYTNVNACGSTKSNQWWTTYPYLNVVCPTSKTGNAIEQYRVRMQNNSMRSSAGSAVSGQDMWIAVDLGQKRMINTLIALPDMNNISAYDIYYTNDDATYQYLESKMSSTVTDIYSLGEAESDGLKPDSWSLTKIYSGTMTRDADQAGVNGTFADAGFRPSRDYMITAQFAETEMRYIIFDVTRCDSDTSSNRVLTDIWSIEAYNFDIDTSGVVSVQNNGENYSYSAVLTNGKIESGSQSNNKNIFITEYQDGIVQYVEVQPITVWSGESVTVCGEYIPKDPTADIEMFVWGTDLEPMCESQVFPKQ